MGDPGFSMAGTAKAVVEACLSESAKRLKLAAPPLSLSSRLRVQKTLLMPATTHRCAYTPLAISRLLDLYASSLLVKAEREHASIRFSACFGFSRLSITLHLHGCWLDVCAKSNLILVCLAPTGPVRSPTCSVNELTQKTSLGAQQHSFVK